MLVLPRTWLIHFFVEALTLFFLDVDSAKHIYLPMHEVTLSTIDRPKLLSQVLRHRIAIGL
jgi:hypothetical protein